MPRTHQFDLRDAANEIEDSKWKCETCTAPVEPGRHDAVYCLSCRLYWEDVAAEVYYPD